MTKRGVSMLHRGDSTPRYGSILRSQRGVSMTKRGKSTKPHGKSMPQRRNVLHQKHGNSMKPRGHPTIRHRNPSSCGVDILQKDVESPDPVRSAVVDLQWLYLIIHQRPYHGRFFCAKMLHSALFVALLTVYP